MSKFRLRFPEDKILYWSERYSYADESEIVSEVASVARARGYLTKEEFVRIARWKTARSQSRCAGNDAALVEEATRLALSSAHEELKIHILVALKGVSWPTASVLLHFCDRAPYPIIDYRALWSLRMPVPSPYTFPFWWEYTCFMRELHQRTRIDMRTLDRALWQYSKERQPSLNRERTRRT